EVAGPPLDEVTQNGASNGYALEGAKTEASHGACCNRSWRKGIADLRSSGGWSRSQRSPMSYADAADLPRKPTAQPSDPRDVCRGVPDRRRCDLGGARGSRRAGDVGQNAGGRRAPDENRRARRAGSERGVVSGRSAFGAHSGDRITPPQ